MYISFASGSQREPHLQWNIGGVGSSGVGHNISCIFHVVCASFSALATRKLADAEANSSGIWALEVHDKYNDKIHITPGNDKVIHTPTPSLFLKKRKPHCQI